MSVAADKIHYQLLCGRKGKVEKKEREREGKGRERVERGREHREGYKGG